MTTPIRCQPIVGRLRLAQHVQGEPTALSTWRVTTDNSTVADALHQLLGGAAPRQWPSRAKDAIEVCTASADASIVIASADAFQSRYIRRDDHTFESTGNNVILPDGSQIADPDRHLSHAERRRKARTTGESLITSLFFRLNDAPELGTFLFRSSSWDLAERFRRSGIREQLAAAADPVSATLRVSDTPAGNSPLRNATAQLLFNR